MGVAGGFLDARFNLILRAWSRLQSRKGREAAASFPSPLLLSALSGQWPFLETRSGCDVN